MSTPITTPTPAEIEYPDCDGNPMSDNTLQYRWIVTIQGNFDALYGDRLDVFVAGDLLWYPVEGDNTTRTAPDAMVVLGRPKGERGSYRQWDEGGIPPQVVWEVLSPGNRRGELQSKFEFYQRFGVEEYYQYDPDRGRLRGWLRRGDQLEEIGDIERGWRSPLTAVRMRLEQSELVLNYPDGRPFLSFVEFARLYDRTLARAEEEGRRRVAAELRSDADRREREAAELRAKAERREREAAELRAQAEQRERKAAAARAERLAAQLRALGIDPDA